MIRDGIQAVFGMGLAAVAGAYLLTHPETLEKVTGAVNLKKLHAPITKP